MSDELKTNQTSDQGNTEVITVELDNSAEEKIKKESAEFERKRVNTIRKLGAKVGADEKLIDRLINEGVALDAAVEELTKFEKKNLIPVPPEKSSPEFKIVAEERDKFNEIAVNAVMLREGMITDHKVKEDVRANGYGGFGLKALAAECLNRRGIPSVHRMSGEELYRNIIRYEAGAIAQGTSDFTGVLANVLRKSAGLGWDNAPVTYNKWTKAGSLSDFKTSRIVKLTAISDVELVPEGEAKKYGKMADLYEQATLFTIGKLLSLTRQSMINDDMSMLTTVPMKLMAAARRYVNRYVYELMRGTNFAGPTMLEDDIACFNTATHGNLVTLGAGGAVSEANVNTGVRAMMTRPLPSPDNGASNVERLNVAPRYLIYGPTQRIPSFRLLNDTYYMTAAGDNQSTQAGNIFKGSMVPVEEVLLDYLVTGYTPWYLAADPGIVDTVTVFSLNGQDSPVVDSEPSRVSEPDGMVWGVRHDFTAAVIDWRGLYCNPGA